MNQAAMSKNHRLNFYIKFVLRKIGNSFREQDI